MWSRPNPSYGYFLGRLLMAERPGSRKIQTPPVAPGFIGRSLWFIATPTLTVCVLSPQPAPLGCSKLTKYPVIVQVLTVYFILCLTARSVIGRDRSNRARRTHNWTPSCPSVAIGGVVRGCSQHADKISADTSVSDPLGTIGVQSVEL